MIETKYPLKRSSMLKKKQEINELFKNGTYFYCNSLKIVWKALETENDNAQVKIFVSVAKKNIKRANKRNLIKRRIKEAIRLNILFIKKFSKQNHININFAVIYTIKTIENYSEIENNIIKSLKKIHDDLSSFIAIKN